MDYEKAVWELEARMQESTDKLKALGANAGGTPFDGDVALLEAGKICAFSEAIKVVKDIDF